MPEIQSNDAFNLKKLDKSIRKNHHRFVALVKLASFLMLVNTVTLVTRLVLDNTIHHNGPWMVFWIGIVVCIIPGAIAIRSPKGSDRVFTQSNADNPNSITVTLKSQPLQKIYTISEIVSENKQYTNWIPNIEGESEISIKRIFQLMCEDIIQASPNNNELEILGTPEGIPENLETILLLKEILKSAMKKNNKNVKIINDSFFLLMPARQANIQDAEQDMDDISILIRPEGQPLGFLPNQSAMRNKDKDKHKEKEEEYNQKYKAEAEPGAPARMEPFIPKSALRGKGLL